MGLRFLASDPEVRILAVQDGHVEAFIKLARSPLLEYRRTAAVCFASFTLHETNKTHMIRAGCIPAILSLVLDKDLATKRDGIFAIANLGDSMELQADLVREGTLQVLCEVANCDDARVQRDTARCFSTLTQTDDVRSELIAQNALPAVLTLAKSLDIASQRYASLTLCNLSCSIPAHKIRLIDDGALRPIIFLSRFPDTEIQRYSALSLAGLALGGHGNNKQRLVDDGCMRPLIDLVRFPDKDVQLAATIAVNAIVIGPEQGTKSAVMTENGLEPLLDLVNKGLDTGLLKKDTTKVKGKSKPSNALKANMHTADHVDEDFEDIFSSAIYCLGSLSENEDVKEKLVELGAIGSVVRHVYTGNFEIKRAAAYFLATVTEQMEFHANLVAEGGLEAIVYLAEMEDIECLEYASFSLAHLASNRDCQVKLVSIGAVRALVSMIASDQEPRHYAGLALLKLADNFENHLKIAEEGGIQALLRLGRSSTSDEQLQYKAALTVGQLASSAVKILPSAEISHATGGHTGRHNAAIMSASMQTANGEEGATIGHGVRVMNKLRTQVDMQKARQRTLEYLDKSLQATQKHMTAIGSDDVPLALEGPAAAATTSSAGDAQKAPRK